MERDQNGDNSKIEFDAADPHSVAAAIVALGEHLAQVRQDSITFATALGIVIGKIERTSSARPISKLFVPLANEPGMVRETSPMAVAFGTGLTAGLSSPPDDGGSKILNFVNKAA